MDVIIKLTPAQLEAIKEITKVRDMTFDKIIEYALEMGFDDLKPRRK